MDKVSIIDDMNSFISDNPGETYRSIASRASLSDSTVWRILHNEQAPTSKTYGKLLFGMKKSAAEVERRKKEMFPDEFDYLPPEPSDGVVYREQAIRKLCDSLDFLKTYLLSLKSDGLGSDDMEMSSKRKDKVLFELLDKGAVREINNRIKGENIRTENSCTHLDLVGAFVNLTKHLHSTEDSGRAFSFFGGLSDEGEKELNKIIKKFKKDIFKLESNASLRGDNVNYLGMAYSQINQEKDS